jgi:hypothetical protein
MKKLSLILVLFTLIACSKEEVVKPINPLAGTNWRGPLAMGPNLIEFTNDSMFEYVDSLDSIFVSSYGMSGNTLRVKGVYSFSWGVKNPYDTIYTTVFRISNDSLFLNGIFRGRKY